MEIGSKLPAKVNMVSSIASSPNRIDLHWSPGWSWDAQTPKNWAEFAMPPVSWDEFPQRSTFTSSLTISSLNLNARFSAWGCWFRDAKHFFTTLGRILSTSSHPEQAPVSLIKRRVGVVDELQEKLIKRIGPNLPPSWHGYLQAVDETPTLRKLELIGRDLPCHLDMIFDAATTFATGNLHPRARSKTCRAH